jgi:TM2 domain-containing membrane protein YozV
MRPSVKGTVLSFEWRESTGAISGEDGNRYRFSGQDWTGDTTPKVGLRVNFVPDGDRAKEIFPEERDRLGGVGSDFASSRKLVAGVLSILLGIWGVHKFYLGYNREGMIMLLAGSIGMILVIPAMVSGVIALVEGIIYLTKSDTEFEQIYVVGKKPWF